jgi:Esterase-like activity of phytase
MPAKIERLQWQDELLAEIVFPARNMRVTRGLGSGLARCAADAPELFWAVGDRGPNIKVKVALDHYGLNDLAAVADVDGAKVMTSLAVGPALTQLRLVGDTISAVHTVALHGDDHQPLRGLPPPASPHAEFEPIFAPDGTPLGTDPSGVDSEGLIALSDGSFWIADEYGPSLLKVARDGKVLRRFVPEEDAAYYAGAAYPIEAVLPRLAVARRLNRGFEALALSPCETWIYVMCQSPLVHPDRAAHESSRHVRIWKLNATSGACAAEYIYVLEKPSSFKRDSAIGDVDRSDIKISEAVMLNSTDMLILERASASTKLYVVRLHPEHETPSLFRDPSTRPTLEQMTRDELKDSGIRTLDKRLIFDTDDAPEVCADLEGMILLSPRTLLLVNDNDFGVEGVETQFWRISFDADLF